MGKIASNFTISRSSSHRNNMKPATILGFAFIALVSTFSVLAQDQDHDMRKMEDEEFKPYNNEDDDEDVPVEGRILGGAPAFGLGLLGGAIGSSLFRRVNSFIGGLRQPPPMLQPAFYPSAFVPAAGFPYGGGFGGGFGGGLRGRSADPRKPGREISPPLTPFVPIPVAPVGFFRSDDSDDSNDDEDEEESFENNQAF